MHASLRNERCREIRRERRGVATLACAADYAALPQAYGTGRATIASSGRGSEKTSETNEPAIASRLDARRPRDAPSRTPSTGQLLKKKEEHASNWTREQRDSETTDVGYSEYSARK